MDKKNTMLLTVIAIATLLVAIVGATFAYFTAQGTGRAEDKIEVTTSSASIGELAGGSLVLNVTHADMKKYDTELNKGYKAKTATTDTPPMVTYTSTSEAGPENIEKLCYTAKLHIDTNDLKTIQDHTEGAGNLAPEQLTIDVSKQTYKVTGKGTEGEQEVSQGSEVVILKDYDLTNNSVDNVAASDYYLPLTKALGKLGNEPIQHVISVNAPQTSIRDKWTVTVGFHNRHYDQTANAGKSFVGSIVFETVVCK